MNTSKDDYRLEMEAQLKEWSTRLEVITTKVSEAKADAKEKLHEQFEKLKALETSGREHLVAVETVAASAWDEAKADLVDKWNQVSGAAEAIWAKVS